MINSGMHSAMMGGYAGGRNLRSKGLSFSASTCSLSRDSLKPGFSRTSATDLSEFTDRRSSIRSGYDQGSNTINPKYFIAIMDMPLAIICCFFNIIVPGFGTMLSGGLIACKLAEVRVDERTRSYSATLNVSIGLLQLLLSIILFIGWIWSISWAFSFIRLSWQQQSRKKRDKAAKTEQATGSATASASTTQTLHRNTKVPEIVVVETSDASDTCNQSHRLNLVAPERSSSVTSDESSPPQQIKASVELTGNMVLEAELIGPANNSCILSGRTSSD